MLKGSTALLALIKKEKVDKEEMCHIKEMAMDVKLLVLEDTTDVRTEDIVILQKLEAVTRTQIEATMTATEAAETIEMTSVVVVILKKTIVFPACRFFIVVKMSFSNSHCLRLLACFSK